MKVFWVIPFCCSFLFLRSVNGFVSTTHHHLQVSFIVQNKAIPPIPMHIISTIPRLSFSHMEKRGHEIEDEHEDEFRDEPIPFVDIQSNNFIECYAERVATVKGIQYTIGTPCDHAVALCSFDTDDQLVPIELDDPLMDDVYPVAESIVEEEFGDELVLQRTPQTLTLVGELDDGEEDEEDDNDEDDDDMEEVEILLSFEHKNVEYSLVRMLDPILLVGKEDVTNQSRRILLTPEEADQVMPALEEMFMMEDEGDE